MKGKQRSSSENQLIISVGNVRFMPDIEVTISEEEQISAGWFITIPYHERKWNAACSNIQHTRKPLIINIKCNYDQCMTSQ